MIKIRIENTDQETDIQFPISENAMYAKLAEIHAAEAADKPHSVSVVEVDWPEEFRFLSGSMVNLDEMNYLGKRMESFDSLEYDQFLVGITKLDTPSPTVKDLINLTFNLDHFTLCSLDPRVCIHPDPCRCLMPSFFSCRGFQKTVSLFL